MPIAVEQLDLSSYDIVISSSHAVAKGIDRSKSTTCLHVLLTNPICLGPAAPISKRVQSTRGLKSALARWILHKIRVWDSAQAMGLITS